MRLRFLVQLMIVVLLVIASCSSEERVQTVTDNEVNEENDEDNDSGLAIDISDVRTELVQAGDVELIENNCTPCHSLRYIQMQPEFSYKTWEKIVDKMITVYGAPIRDSFTRQHIIDYLYAIKGKEESQKGGH